MLGMQMRISDTIELSSYIRSYIDIANGIEIDYYNFGYNNHANFSRFEYLNSLIQDKINVLQSTH